MPPDAADATTTSTALTVVPTDIPAATPAPDRRIEDFRMIPLSLIDQNPDQPRHAFTDKSISAMKESIEERGLLHPIVVMPTEGGRWRLLAGERRRRAYIEMGRTEIPAVAVAPDIPAPELLALTENTNRQNLDIVELASAAVRLSTSKKDYNRDMIARALGKSPAAVSRAGSLKWLPPEILLEYAQDINVGPDMVPPRKDAVPIRTVVTQSDLLDVAAMWTAARKAWLKKHVLSDEVLEALRTCWQQVRIGKWKRDDIREVTRQIKEHVLAKPSEQVEILNDEVKSLTKSLSSKLSRLSVARHELKQEQVVQADSDQYGTQFDSDSGDCIEIREVGQSFRALIADGGTPTDLLIEQIGLVQEMLDDARGRGWPRDAMFAKTSLRELEQSLHATIDHVWNEVDGGKDGYPEAVRNLRAAWNAVKAFGVAPSGYDALTRTFFFDELTAMCAADDPRGLMPTISSAIHSLYTAVSQQNIKDRAFEDIFRTYGNQLADALADGDSIRGKKCFADAVAEFQRAWEVVKMSDKKVGYTVGGEIILRKMLPEFHEVVSGGNHCRTMESMMDGMFELISDIEKAPTAYRVVAYRAYVRSLAVASRRLARALGVSADAETESDSQMLAANSASGSKTNKQDAFMEAVIEEALAAN